jgi:hypothetical protein
MGGFSMDKKLYDIICDWIQMLDDGEIAAVIDEMKDELETYRRENRK